ncbi:hypothetical protein KDL44_07220 [bacterium]|nr:hypothetical protein [bacterium]
MPLELNIMIDDPRLLLGVVEISGGTLAASSAELQQACTALAATVCVEDFSLDEGRRSSVRKLLKLAGFSATGRNKPAQEFLLADVRERGEFNLINNCVDVNNYISLKHCLPISILDAGKLDGRLTVRIAAEGEGYVFNNAGHLIDMKKSICLCRGAGEGEPTGGPVKDSMATKIFEGATEYIAMMYASTEGFSREDVQAAVDEMATLLSRETGGSVVRQTVLPD